MQYLKKELKELLLKVALRQFSLYGYEATTMRSISKEAGITAPNIYRYFSSKEELYKQLVVPAYHVIKDLFRMNANATLTPAEVGQILLGRLPQLLQHYRDELIILLDGSKGTTFAGAKEEITVILSEDIARHIGVLNKETGAPVFDQMMARPMAVSFLEGVMDIIRRHEHPDDIVKLTTQFIQMYFFWSVRV
ncbi:helix-turn-helix domain-containing protein [Paenibacillus sp. GD4]|jgi:AcrR family transcriptional regulator|uniref:TetR/AcrR family transcriptional regulator n=1 Tax=Paenibacillus sp. GD4 TaxID=3068890 RepID=UPI002796DBC9|nr:TetR/AcrR family transcriptional regulator [Paenibacillus sp. GD4]MDQ1909064.1 helix-turn-helix domain-containing protein [Paenibacillus sp. GD4]